MLGSAASLLLPSSDSLLEAVNLAPSILMTTLLGPVQGKSTQSYGFAQPGFGSVMCVIASTL